MMHSLSSVEWNDAKPFVVVKSLVLEGYSLIGVQQQPLQNNQQKQQQQQMRSESS